MGNICRSPTAEAVFKHVVNEAGLSARIRSDSAGTHAYHIGDPPDARAQRHAAKRGYDLSALRARRVEAADFERFDYVLAMDETNLTALRRLCPAQYRERVKLFLEFAPEAGRRDVPDPYYGGAQGFEDVLDLVELAAEGLLDHIAGSR